MVPFQDWPTREDDMQIHIPFTPHIQNAQSHHTIYYNLETFQDWIWSKLDSYIVLRLLLWVSVEMYDLAVVPAPVSLLDVGQVEAGCSQTFPVTRLHLGYPAVVGGGVKEVIGAVGGVVVIPATNNN